MSLVKKIVIGVLIYLIFLVVLFPAQLALSLAPLPKSVTVSGVNGTIWNGSIDNLSIQQRQLESVQWQLSPWGLLLATANLDVVIGNRATAVNGRGEVSLSMGGVNAQGLRFEAPSDFLLGNTRLPFRTKVDGSISLFVDELAQGTPWCEQLSGKLFVNRAQVNNQFGEYPLGDMEIGLSCIDGNVKLNSDESMNQLGFVGSVLLKADSQVQVSAKVKETPQQPKDLKQALAFLGKKDSQGYYPISYQGRVPGL
ncbi:type II secretion system protein N [Shewanella waksmanii]|uniref:type II secretion system protein N n=1 Tax=Shewanella waksmanii TaxID=213783 RepID=UPI0037369B9D